MTQSIVAIGASGSQGLKDLRELLLAFPKTIDAVVLAVLHRSPDSKSQLLRILSEESPIPVVIAEQGERVRTGVCYIGEPAEHLSLLSAKFTVSRVT
jgi:two-component system, chemotaxis family, protein-glutamate methylesterase/glutaminase